MKWFHKKSFFFTIEGFPKKRETIAMGQDNYKSSGQSVPGLITSQIYEDAK